MSDSAPPPPVYRPPSPPGPPYRVPPPPPPRRGPSFFRILAAIFSFLVFSLVLLGFGFVAGVFVGAGGGGNLTERHYSGKAASHDKIAIIKIEGVLLEGRTSFAEKQIEQAMK